MLIVLPKLIGKANIPNPNLQKESQKKMES